jgi:hypothetical protein
MGDLEDRLREALRQRAAGVPPRLEVPKGMLQRARWRVARNLLGVLMAIAIVSVGTVTAIHALSGPVPRVPTMPAPSSSACLASNLTGESKLTGNGTSREGSLVLTNSGQTPCTLEGRPTVSIIAQGTFRRLSNKAADPWWKVNGKASPERVVTLLPGEAAQIRVIWSSWCRSLRVSGAWLWQIMLPGAREPLRLVLNTAKDIPSCVDNRSSNLKVGPFEPAPATPGGR